MERYYKSFRQTKLQQGNEHYHHGRYFEALEAYQKALENVQKQPDNVKNFKEETIILNRIIATYNNLRKFKEAEDACNVLVDKLLKLQRMTGEKQRLLTKAWIRKGGAHFFQGDYAAAVKCYERALQLTPDHPKANEYLKQAKGRLKYLGSKKHTSVDVKFKEGTDQKTEMELVKIAKTKPQKKKSLQDLPGDEFLYMCTFLDLKSIAALMRTSTHFYNLTQSNMLWKALCMRDLWVLSMAKNWKKYYETTKAYQGIVTEQEKRESLWNSIFNNTVIGALVGGAVIYVANWMRSRFLGS